VDLAGFLAVATVVVVAPGPDMALVARNTFVGGRRSGLATSAGTCSGLLVHSVAAALGLSALLLASSNAFTALKLLGACYLVFLGLRSLLANRRRAEASTAPRTVTPWTAYRQGLATNVLNPKVALFFVAMLPQFVEPGEGFVWRLLALSGVFIAMGLVWLAGYTIAIHAVGRSLDRASIRRWFERVSGVVLVALGVRLALARD
jgi:threonine/homoserine/homoserine lactone efflux protein